MELANMNVESFLKRNRITEADWKSANIGWEELKAIGLDHHKNTPDLEAAAELLAKMLQKCNSVHSIRWRIKNPEHLMEKIVRRRVKGNEKYKSISVSDYAEKVTDLIGIRVIHLFKYEWEDIHKYILESWQPTDNVIAYIREGDENATVDSYKRNECEVKHHPAGYRSIHYVIPTKPGKKTFFSEIQVRTIFEEGWSEIDHKIRYPNFSNNELISYFLTMFNRMAGNADEMGTFVKSLSSETLQQETKAAEIKREQEEHLSKIEALALELSQEKNKSKVKDNNLKKLNEEIKKLRNNSANYSNFVDSQVSLLGGAFAKSALAELNNLKNLNSISEILNKNRTDDLIGGSVTKSALAELNNLKNLNSISEILNKNKTDDLIGGSVTKSALTELNNLKNLNSISEILNNNKIDGLLDSALINNKKKPRKG